MLSWSSAFGLSPMPLVSSGLEHKFLIMSGVIMFCDYWYIVTKDIIFLLIRSNRTTGRRSHA